MKHNSGKLILRKEWGRLRDKDTRFFQQVLPAFNRLSVETLNANRHRLLPETIDAFNLFSIICKTRQWEWPWAIKQVYNNFGSIRRSGLNVLDIGCGFRPFTLFLRSLGYNVTAVDDMSWEHKEDLGVLLGELGINFIEAKAEDLPFQSETFDCAFCISVMEHCPTEIVKQIVSEGCRVTKNDGLFVATIDAHDSVQSLLPEYTIPGDVVATFEGKPVAGVVFRGSK